jgi:hypothetical protein
MAFRSFARSSLLFLLMLPLPWAVGDALAAQEFVSPTPAAGALFGSAVAFSGTNIVIGAPEAAAGTVDIGSGVTVPLQGEIHLFAPSGGAPLFTIKNPANSATNLGELFGISVAGTPTRLFAGSPFSGSSGTVYVFDATTGAPLPPLQVPPPGGLGLGFSVATDGNLVASGAPQDVVGSTTAAGAVYVFDATGQLLQTLTSPTPETNGSFGATVAVGGGSVLVGQPFVQQNSTNGLGAGSAYLFDVGKSAPRLTFASPSRANSDLFGGSVALVGGNVLIGAFGANNFAGAAFLFDGTSGALLHTFTNPNPSVPVVLFGCGVGALGGDVVVGSATTTFRFNASTGALDGMMALPAGSVVTPGLSLGCPLATQGTEALVGVPSSNADGVGGGAAFLFGSADFGSAPSGGAPGCIGSDSSICQTTTVVEQPGRGAAPPSILVTLPPVPVKNARWDAQGFAPPLSAKSTAIAQAAGGAPQGLVPVTKRLSGHLSKTRSVKVHLKLNKLGKKLLKQAGSLDVTVRARVTAHSKEVEQMLKQVGLH